MSLSLALSASMSGIALTSRATQLVADNIANQQTEGYGVRSLDQAARSLGGTGSGVVALGIHRDTDPGLIAEHRKASAQSARHQQVTEFWNRVEATIGIPGEAGSLNQRMDALEIALGHAAAQPDSQALLHQVAQATTDIAHGFLAIQTSLQHSRNSADALIARDVDTLNDTLSELARLNREIQRQTLTGGAPHALMDNRQRLIDQIAEIVPVTEIMRENGRIALLAEDGSILVDRDAAQFGFTRTTAISPEDRVETGALSGLSLNDRAVPPGSALLSEGRLGAAFAVRDRFAPELQQSLDQIATDLVTRFTQAEASPTTPAGAFGLLVPEGVLAWPASQPGLAGRLRLNPLADPAAGGDVTLLRSGLHAAQPAAVSDNQHLTRLRDALTQMSQLPGAMSPHRAASGHVTDMLSQVATARLGAEQRSASSTARFTALQESVAARGVDTDAELGKLLLLEQAYAANARVLATLDAMLRRILEI